MREDDDFDRIARGIFRFAAFLGIMAVILVSGLFFTFMYILIKNWG